MLLVMAIFAVVALTTGYVVAPRWWWRQSVLHAPPRALFANWRIFSRAHGLRLEEPGMRVETRMPFMHGRLGDCEIGLAVIPGSGSGFETRLTARGSNTLEVCLYLEGRNAPSSSAFPPFDTADVAFDSVFRATADNAACAGRLLDETVRGALLAVAGYPGIEIKYEKGEIEMTWDGGEGDPEALGAALSAGVALSTWRAAVGYR
ncbi:hypothetical protein LVJ94_46590 [Pendulispora rubella]|uniref:Uncharacterized protein n=1 Tax=Pendulispora rubella TaxID=2741070 RepID=A0ABZ2L201_9BACT